MNRDDINTFSGKRRAVVVGVNKPGDPELEQLACAVPDAADLARILMDPSRGRFEQVVLMTDDSPDDLRPTMGWILRKIDLICENAEAEDLILVFFACHAVVFQTEVYLIANDASSVERSIRAVKLDEVCQKMVESKAKEKVLILDVCYSGQALAESPEDKGRSIREATFRNRENITILTSCGPWGRAKEPIIGRHSVYMAYFLEGLEGKADTENKGYVTVQDIHNFVKPKVQHWSLKRGLSQIPAMYPETSDVVLAQCRTVDNLTPQRRKLFQRFDDEFETLSERLSNFSDRLPLQEHINRLEIIREAKEKERLTISVFGRIKAGKSTLVNALIGSDLSPADVGRTTTVLLRIHHGKRGEAHIFWSDGRKEPKSLDDLGTWMQGLSEDDLRRINEVVITTDNPILDYGRELHILDMAGAGGRVLLDDVKIREQIERAVVAILVFTYRDPETRDYADLLDKLAQQRKVHLFAVCNVDPNYRDEQKSKPDRVEDFMRSKEEELIGYKAECLRIDAAKALRGKRLQDEDEIRSSGIRELEDKIRRYLLRAGDVEALRDRVGDVTNLITQMRRQVGENRNTLKEKVHTIEKQIANVRAEAKDLTDNARRVEDSIRDYDGARYNPQKGGALGAGLGVAAGAIAASTLPVTGPIILGGLGLGALCGFIWGNHSKNSRYKSAKGNLEKFPNDVLRSRSPLIRDEIKSIISGLREMKTSSHEESENIIRRLEEIKGDIKAQENLEISELKSDNDYQRYYSYLDLDKELNQSESAFRRIESDIKAFLPHLRNVVEGAMKDDQVSAQVGAEQPTLAGESKGIQFGPRGSSIPLPEGIQIAANLYTVSNLGDALVPALEGELSDEDGVPIWRVKVFHKKTHQLRGELHISQDNKKVVWHSVEKDPVHGDTNA